MSYFLQPEYRADVDGLRAVAVLAVVGFHVFPKSIRGGFIGVDIFFVISGFLISIIILANLRSNTFSIINFYNRRVRRIFPALIVVTIICLILGWFLLFADEYAQLGKHVAGGMAFISNNLSYRERGYFDSAAYAKPMLHLWSLAVEEQFYIIWPTFLAIIWNRRWNFLWAIFLVGVLSFVVNIYFINSNPKAAFFWSVTRFWELMLGSTLAYLTIQKKMVGEFAANILSLTGFMLLFLGFALINGDSKFPGWFALLPVMGTFFVIAAGPSAYLNRYVLSSRVMVVVGLISYPLYLWHWPLLSFLQIIEGDNPSLQHRIILVLLSLFLAWLTYHFVELKIRATIGYKATLSLLAVAIGVFVVSISIKMTGGMPSREFNEKMDFLRTLDVFDGSRNSDKSCTKFNHLNLLDEEVCISNSKNPEVLFVGDSHAMALYSAIYAKKIGVSSMLVAGHGCRLYPNLYYVPTYEFRFDNNCTAIAAHVLEVAKSSSSINTVVLVTQHPYSNQDARALSKYYWDGKRLNNEDAFSSGEGYLVKQLLGLGKRVVFVIDVPRLKNDPRNCVQRVSFVDARKCETTIDELKAMRSGFMDTLAEFLPKYPGLEIFSPFDVFCDAGSCKLKDSGGYLYNDEHHISVNASAKVLERMRLAGLLPADSL